MNIAEIREKYPQYNNLSDDDLAARIYQKKYAGVITEPDFNRRVGLTEKGIIARSVDAVTGAVGSVVDSVRGDAEFDLPNINQAGKDTFGTAKASMFGDDEDYLRAAQEAHPDLNFSKDANGNNMAVDANGKPLFYVNQPGLDLEDVTRFAGKAASFFPAARVATVPASIIGRSMSAFGTAAATDAGMQWAAGRDDIDPAQVTLTAMAGMFGELGGSALSALGRRFNWGKAPTVDEGRDALRALGITHDVADDIALRYAQGAREHLAPNVRPAAVVAAREFGFKPDPSQQVDDFWRARDVARESSTRVASAQNQQIDSVLDAGDSIAGQLGGRGDDAAEYAMNSVQRTAADRLEEANQAYTQAGRLDGEVQGGAFDGLFDRINSFADKKFLRGTHNAPVYPASQSILGNMDGLANQIKALRSSADVTDFNAPFEAVENFRQAIVAATRSAKGKDMAHAKGLMAEFDSWVDDVFDNNLINGSTEFLDQASNARALWSRYKQDFGERWLKVGNDAFGKKLEQFTNGDGSMDAQAMASFVLGAGNRINQSMSKQFAKRLKHVLPEDGWNAFRQATFEKLLRQEYTGEKFGLRAIANNLKSATKGQNRGLFDEILTNEEKNLIERYAMGIEGLLPTGHVQRQGAKSSGTSERWLGMLLSRIEGLPVIGGLSRMHQSAINTQYTNPSLLLQAQPKATTALAPAAVN